MGADEIVQIVDKDNNPAGSCKRSEMRKMGLIHRATYILVFNSKGDVFVQERTLTKDIFPGYLDICTGGVVLANETYEESAARELAEEIGVTDVPLTFLFDFYGEYKGQKVWGRVFKCITEGPFVLQEEEVASGRFFTKEEVFKLISEKPCTPDSAYVFLRHASE